MRSLYIFLLLVVSSAISCKTAKPAAGGNVVAPVSVSSTADKKDHILAVILKATRDGNDKIVFEISKVNKVEGKLKPGQNDNSGKDYIVAFATEKDQELKAYYIKDPLNTWIESSEENGKLINTPVKKDEEYISMRTNYTPDMKHLIIKKNASDSNKISLPIIIQ